ncbi:Uma2 family endonuclease [Cylindrospermopsis raciborskii]|uniref:Uma2 family endonuclease n=1 Tax=Cylindrospermopsis raciborskii TaxID=77022 RepID=UPI0022C3582D|nr:Uma2 family endonuclease [Cylindrospermopsis raciborskii]MCZ2206994.1 Uma2 family endonuclease [Cylindrospermopsis raciborskii PAMP2011]
MYQSEAPPLKTIAADLPDKDIDEELNSTIHPRPPWETLPTMYDLPSENPEEPGLPDEFHNFQPQLLRETCQSSVYPREEMFIGTDLNLYYDVHHFSWYKRPDWFLVLGAPASETQQDMRLSYVIWQEGFAPFLIVELLSPGTEAEDLGKTSRSANKPPTKWQVYEQYLRSPYYIIFDRYENQLRVFQLLGIKYQAVELTEPKYWFAELKLGVGVWSGKYQGTEGLWLRWYNEDGDWILTSDETAEREKQRAEQERLAKEQAEAMTIQERQQRELAEGLVIQERAEKQREREQREIAEAMAIEEREKKEKLAARLRSLGINPDDI